MSEPLSPMDRLLIEQSVTNDGPNTAIAYLLWIIGGIFGFHRFYLGRPKSALLMIITLGGVGFWAIIDLFLMPNMVRNKRADVRRRYTAAATGLTVEESYVPPKKEPTSRDLTRGALIAGGLLVLLLIAASLGHPLDGSHVAAPAQPATAVNPEPQPPIPVTHHHRHRS